MTGGNPGEARGRTARGGRTCPESQERDCRMKFVGPLRAVDHGTGPFAANTLSDKNCEVTLSSQRHRDLSFVNASNFASARYVWPGISARFGTVSVRGWSACVWNAGPSASWIAVSRSSRLPAAVLDRDQHFAGCRWRPQLRAYPPKVAGVFCAGRAVGDLPYLGCSSTRSICGRSSERCLS